MKMNLLHKTEQKDEEIEEEEVEVRGKREMNWKKRKEIFTNQMYEWITIDSINSIYTKKKNPLFRIPLAPVVHIFACMNN